MVATLTADATAADPVAPARGSRPTGPTGPTRRRHTAPTAGTLIGWSLVIPGVLILLFGGWLFGASRFPADRAQALAYPELVRDLKLSAVPVGGAIPAGTPVGILRINAIDVDQVFVMGSASEQTENGPGLRRDTVLPGQAGSSVLVGRRTTYAAPFRRLAELHPGDVITAVTGQGKFTYVVDLVRTSDARPSTIKAAASRLTLITSDPILAPSRNLVVSAVLKGDPQPRSTGQASSAADVPGHGSHGSLVWLLLWSQALLVASALVTWAALRLERTAVWIGAAPVLLTFLWHVFENLARLLPNTL
jgi:sortase A